MTYIKSIQRPDTQSQSSTTEEAAVLDKLYDDFSPVLYGLILRILKDEVMAEETMFDCFATIRASYSKFAEAREGICRSLLTLARELALEKAQTKQYRYQLLARELYKCRIYLSENVEQDQFPAGKPEVNVLPETLKGALDKVYFEGMSIPEVASKSGLTDKQVRYNITQAITTLKSIQKK